MNYTSYIGYGYIIYPKDFDNYFDDKFEEYEQGEDYTNNIWAFFYPFDDVGTSYYCEDQGYGFYGIILSSACTDELDWFTPFDMTTILSNNYKENWTKCCELLNKLCPDIYLTQKPKVYNFITQS